MEKNEPKIPFEELPDLGYYDDKRLDASALPLDTETIVNKIIEEDESLKKYEHVGTIKNLTFIKRFADNKGLNKKYKSIVVDSEPDISDVEYEYRTDNHALIVKRYVFERETSVCFVFYNDEKTLLEDLTIESSIYEKGEIYKVMEDMRGYHLSKIQVSDEEAPYLEDDLEKTIQEDIEKFFNNRKFYKKNKLSYKRGILLYGPPGNGKTSLIRTILKNNKDKAFCVIIDCKKAFENEIEDYLKKVLDDDRKILVFEDIDSLQSYERSHFLNFLDGINTFENAVFIATTNNMNEVDYALVDRPSRFDRAYNIEMPSPSVRRKLLKKFFPEEKEEIIEEAVKETEGFSGAYFKELFICKNINEEKLLDTIKDVKTQMYNYKKFKQDSSYLG